MTLLSRARLPARCSASRSAARSWKLGGCTVELDELPHLGTFVEIEGPSEAAILKVRDQLQLDRAAAREGELHRAADDPPAGTWRVPTKTVTFENATTAATSRADQRRARASRCTRRPRYTPSRLRSPTAQAPSKHEPRSCARVATVRAEVRSNSQASSRWREPLAEFIERANARRAALLLPATSPECHRARDTTGRPFRRSASRLPGAVAERDRAAQDREDLRAKLIAFDEVDVSVDSCSCGCSLRKKQPQAV